MINVKMIEEIPSIGKIEASLYLVLNTHSKNSKVSARKTESIIVFTEKTSMIVA